MNKKIEIKIIPYIYRRPNDEDSGASYGEAAVFEMEAMDFETSAELESRALREASKFVKGSSTSNIGLAVIVRPRYAAYEWRSFCGSELRRVSFEWWFDHDVVETKSLT